jgi:hypothetical protein
MTPNPGVNAALAGSPAVRTAPSLFSLADRVALVTGGHRGIGLEMALALAEAGAVVYCLDLPAKPDSDWLKVQNYANGLQQDAGQKKGRLEYVSGDVTDQKAMWATVESIVDREGRIDICMANAGILHGAECLEYAAEDFKRVRFQIREKRCHCLNEGLGLGHQRLRRAIYRPGRGKANGAPQNPWEHRFNRVYEWDDNQPRKLNLSSFAQLTQLIRGCTSFIEAALGCVQHQQVRRRPNGSLLSVRASA